jgi:integrase
VAAAKPKPGSVIKITGQDFKNFLLVVYPSGRKSFAVRYRHGRDRKMIMLGDYGPLTVDAARKLALDTLGRVVHGEDPSEERAKARAEGSFAAWANEYVERAKGRKKTWRRDVQYLGLAKDLFGKKRLSEVTTRDCDVFFERTREQRGDVSANRALASLRACLQTAWRLGYIEANPAGRVKPLREPPPRTRVFNDDETRRLLDAIAALKDPHAKAGLLILFATGARLSEVLNLRWEDVDLDGCFIRLPNPKSGKPQSIPLARPLRDYLAALSRVSTYVVAGKNPSEPRHDLKRAWKAVTTAAGVAGNIHDIRRTVGTRLASQYGLEVAQHVLRHSSATTTWRHYVSAQDKDLRHALEGVNATSGVARVLQFQKGGVA